MKKNNQITLILEADNGFSKRMKGYFVPKIQIPFTWKIRISSPVIGDHFDVNPTVFGEFVVYKKTKKTAWYRLVNLTEVLNPEIK